MRQLGDITKIRERKVVDQMVNANRFLSELLRVRPPEVKADKVYAIPEHNQFIKRGAAIETVWKHDDKDAIVSALNMEIPAADVAPVVFCKDCKYRIVNEHYGEAGYIKLKAMCDLDTGDQFELGRCAEDDYWFCADGERKDSDNV